MNRLEGKIAIVTGGAGGIGKATGALFEAEGASVLLVDRDAEALKTAAAAIGSNRVATCVADVSQPQDNEMMVRTAVERFGGVDILIANAGIERPWKTSTGSWPSMSAVSGWV
jgi:3alpha(or 20beta)-hydroxysteroid dehydrogenase